MQIYVFWYMCSEVFFFSSFSHLTPAPYNEWNRKKSANENVNKPTTTSKEKKSVTFNSIFCYLKVIIILHRIISNTHGPRRIVVWSGRIVRYKRIHVHCTRQISKKPVKKRANLFTYLLSKMNGEMKRWNMLTHWLSKDHLISLKLLLKCWVELWKKKQQHTHAHMSRSGVCLKNSIASIHLLPSHGFITYKKRKCEHDFCHHTYIAWI